MTKTKKLVALLVVLAMVMTLVLAACGSTHECADPCPTCDKCTTECEDKACADKCLGHGSTGGDTHECTSKCTEPGCGKCTNTACTETACAQKCPGHQPQGGTECQCGGDKSQCQCTDCECSECEGGQQGGGYTTQFPVSTYADLTTAANASSTDKFYVAGQIKSITDAFNSTIILEDAEKATFQIYGVFNEDGTVRDETPSTSLAVGDFVVFYGGLTVYNQTAQMSNGWLVQHNNDVITSTAAILLATITIASPASSDFELPTAEGKITWSVKSGTGITIEGSTAKVTRTAEEQTVVLTATATVDGTPANKDFTVVIPLKAQGQETVILNVDTLEVPGSTYTNNGGATVGGVEFSWIGMGNYGDGLQMRTNTSTGTSSFWNAQAFGSKITKIELVWSSTKDVSTRENVLKVELANDVNFTDVESQLVTFTGSTYVIEPTSFNTFVRITHNDAGAVYLAEVRITYADDGTSLTDQSFSVSVEGEDITDKVTVTKTDGTSQLDSTYQGGTTVEFKVNPQPGWKVTDVKVNGTTVRATEGVYSFLIKQHSTIVITLGEDNGGGGEQNVGTWQLVTSIDDITSGAKYIIGSVINGKVYAMGIADAVSNYVALDVSDGVIAKQEDSFANWYTITIEGGSYYLQTSDGKWLSGSSSSNAFNVNNTKTAATITINGSTNQATITSGRILAFNNSNGQTRYRFYQESTITGTTTSSSYFLPYIYKLVEA